MNRRVCRPCARSCSCHSRSSAQKGRDLLRELLSPVSFGRCVLHRTPGPPIRPMPARRCAHCPPSNAACCCCCAPARRLPWPCRSHHHHPSPGRPPASISTLLTRPSAVRASFLPFCVPCVQLSCGASSDRFGRQGSCQGGRSSAGDGRSVGGGGGGGLVARIGRWQSRARPFEGLRRPSEAAAEQQQQQERRSRPQKGASGGLGAGREAYVAAGGARRRRRVTPGGLPAVASMHASACCFSRKKLGPRS